MSLPNDDNTKADAQNAQLNESRDIVSDSTLVDKIMKPEQAETNSEPARDDMDDIEDYLFLKSHKSKSHKTHSDSQSAMLPFDDDYPILKSNNESAKVKHKRHSKYSYSNKHSSRHKKRKMKTYKKVLLSIGCILLAMVVLVVGIAALLINRGGGELLTDSYSISAPDGVSIQNNGEYVVYNGHTYKFNENITNILCMGVDRRDLEVTETGTTGGQADAIILIALDTSSGKTTLINISRDTMTDVAIYTVAGTYVETVTQQLCLSYAYGDGQETSCENTIVSVQRLFYNLPINSYLALDLDGISAINDSVGGVDVTSPETISSFVEGETYHLEGDMAEDFVRSRDTEQLESNSGRMKRQQEYIGSFINKVVSQTKEDIFTPLDLFNAASEYTCTNINASKVSYIAANVVMSNGLSIETMSVPGEIKAGEQYAEFYVDETEFYEMFLSVFYTQIA